MKLVLYVCDGTIAECVKRLNKNNVLSFCYAEGYRGNLPLKPEVEVEALSGTDYDYIIVVTNDKNCSERAVRELLQKNIPEDRLIEYCWCKKEQTIRPVEIFWRDGSRKKYENFVFGMSHSYGGFLTCMLKGATYKFSAPSMDLYYHYLVLKDLCTNYEMASVKRVIFELPYYIFNYDLSKCKKTFELRREYYGYYKNLHNFVGTEEEKKHIFMNEIWYGLCEDRKQSFNRENCILRKQFLRFRYFSMNKEPHYWTVEEKEYVAALRPHVWYREYEETVKENIYIWQLIQEMLKRLENIDIVVCVFPFCNYFVDENEKAIERNKEAFYKHIYFPRIRILDYFNIYENRPEYFQDECHLNILGAYKFSKMISERLDKRLYV